MAAGAPFTFLRFVVRWFFCAFLLFATYNPSGFSYVHWILTDTEYVAIKVFCGLVLLSVYVPIVTIVWTSLGVLGIGMTLALMAACGLISLEYLPAAVMPWQVYEFGLLLVGATIFALGLSWGHISLQVLSLKLAHKIYTH